MASDKEEGGCLKLFIGIILFIVVGAFVYFILSPLVLTILPFVFIGGVTLFIVVAIISHFEN